MSKSILILLISLLACISAQDNFYGKNSALYTFTQKPDHSCSNDKECDGLRTCVNSKCSGIARMPKDPFYMFDNIEGNCRTAPFDIRNYLCTGQRVCAPAYGCYGPAALPKSVFYYYNETAGNTVLGHQKGCLYPPLSDSLMELNKYKDYRCDGLRTCSVKGVCQGTSRPQKNQVYFYDQPTSHACPKWFSDPNYCMRDYACDGLRTCSDAGLCSGTARPLKDVFYSFNESLTGLRCISQQSNSLYKLRDYTCDGLRTCSAYGWCQGTARPPKDAKYFYDEAKRGYRCPNLTTDRDLPLKDYYCTGTRTCSAYGWCQNPAK